MKKKIYIILAIIVLLVGIGFGIIYFNSKGKVAVLCYHNMATASEKVNFPDQ